MPAKASRSAACGAERRQNHYYFNALRRLDPRVRWGDTGTRAVAAKAFSIAVSCDFKGLRGLFHRTRRPFYSRSLTVLNIPAPGGRRTAALASREQQTTGRRVWQENVDFSETRPRGQRPTAASSKSQKRSAVACRTPLSLPTFSNTWGGASPSIDTSAIAEPPGSSRPRAKVAILTPASPKTLANRPMKPGLSSLVT